MFAEIGEGEEQENKPKKAKLLKIPFPIQSQVGAAMRDFDMIKDISDDSNGFAERIYESGNSFEQLEDFFNKISA